MLVRTPEQVLRETRCNLYFIQFSQSPFEMGKIEDIPGRKELRAWFAKECPEIELENLGPPEGSGWISGGIGILMRVGFDKASLAKFCAVWENADGSSKDPRWQCHIYGYRDYLKRAKEIRQQRKEMAENW